VIPAYNSDRYLGSTIDTIVGQTLSDWELVVFDDGSTDGTAALARRYADQDRRVRVATGPNQGVAATRNRGFALTDSRSEYVIFLDNDDQWEHRALETLVCLLDAHPEYGAAHCLARCIDGDGQALAGDDLEDHMRARHGFQNRSLVAIPLAEPTTFAALAYHNWVVTPGTLMMRRPVAMRAGLFDERAVPADDWDMAVRVSRLTDIGYIDQPLLWWRRHGGAQSYSMSWRRAYVYVRAKMLMNGANSPHHTKVARQGFVNVSRSTLAEAGRNARRRDVRRAVTQGAKGLYQFTFWLWAEVRRAIGSVERLVRKRRIFRP